MHLSIRVGLCRYCGLLTEAGGHLQSQPKVSGHPQKKALPRFPSFNVAPMMSTFLLIFFPNLQNNVGRGYGGKRKPLSNVIVWDCSMGPRVPFVSNPFGAISPNKVVETETETETNRSQTPTSCEWYQWNSNPTLPDFGNILPMHAHQRL